MTSKTTAATSTAGAALVLSWAVRTVWGVEVPLEVSLTVAGGLAWLAALLTDKRGRHERA
jgi:hypothetical protein